MKLTFNKTIPRFAGAVLLTVAAIMPARADYPSTVQALGPVGYWRFDDTAASPPLNIITNATALGSIANGFCVATATKGAPGIIGTSVRFNNPGNNVALCNDKIDVPWNAALNPNPPFSIEFWADANSLGSDSTGFSPLENFDPNFSGGSRAGWLFYLNSTGRWQFRLGNRGGYAGIVTATSGNASPGSWQHIVATWDGTNAFLYANGVQIGSAAVPVANWVDNPQSFIRIGGTPLTGNNAVTVNLISATSNNGNRGFDGWVEEVAIYTNVLSPSTVSAHYSAASTNNAGYNTQIMATHPVGYWPMNDAAYGPPPTTFPVAVNSGSLGAAANGTNYWGALADQPGPGYAGFGASDKAVFFDGDNGYCQINDTPGMHITGTISFATWIKPTEEDYFRDIIEHGWDHNFAETFLRISRGIGPDFTGDGNYYEVGASDGQTYYDSVLFPIPPGDIGNWVFLGGTFDGANWNLYRNGTLVGSTPATGTDTGAVSVTNLWTIGSRGPDAFFQGQGMFFGGTMDEPAIFTSVLAGSDFFNLYNAAEVPPVFTRPVQNPGTVFLGQTVPFSVWVEGSPTLGYLWMSNGISTGVTATNYTISNIPLGNFTIALVATNAYGTNTSTVSFAAVNQPPGIVTPPSPTLRFVGFPFSFSVVARGNSPLSYYWYLGSTLIQSGASPVYSSTASLANAGLYTVVVSNNIGPNATSAPVALTVKAIPNGYPGQVIANGPISYYRMDETNGTVCHDGISGHDGTYFNAVLGQPGYSIFDPDTAVSFDGLNSYVGNISGTAINFTQHTNFTLEAWVNAPAGQSDQASIIAKGIGNNGTTETEQFAIDVVGGVYHFFASRGTVLASVTASDGPDGTWQHIVGVYDDLDVLGAGSNMTLYINGVAEASGPTLGGPGLNDTLTPVSIGSKRTGNDPNYDGTFDGTVDEVAIYSKALSAAMVQADYASAYSNVAPFISIQPVPTTNYAGLPTTLSVVAAGSVPLTFQWILNGVGIPGANSAKYTVNPTAFSDAGNYSVGITNSLGGTNSITVPLVVLAAPTNPPAIPGLVLHLTFDNTLADSSGRTNNGTGKHATIVGSTTNFSTLSPSPSNPEFTYVADGALGQALRYETDAYLNTNSGIAFATNNYYVTLGVPSDLQFDTTVSFTVSYWIRGPQGFGAVPGFGGDLPFFTDTAGSTFGNGFVFAPAYGYGTVNPNPATAPTSYGGWAASIYGAGTGVGVYGDLGSINDGNWHHLLHIINHTTSTFTTYLDGLVAHYTVTGGSVLGAAGDIDTGLAANIGQDPTGLYPEAGTYDIDDLGVWRKALTPLEAASIYIAGVSNKLSYVNAPITFSMHKGANNTITLTWNYGTLVSSTNVVGPYTPVAGAVSPYTTTASPGTKFFRVQGF